MDNVKEIIFSLYVGARPDAREGDGEGARRLAIKGGFWYNVAEIHKKLDVYECCDIWAPLLPRGTGQRPGGKGAVTHMSAMIFGRPLKWYLWCLLIFLGISQLLGAFAALGGLRDDYVAKFVASEKVEADAAPGLTRGKYYFVSGPAFPRDAKETSGLIYYIEQTKRFGGRSSWVSGQNRTGHLLVGAKKKILAVRHDSYSEALRDSGINDRWKREEFEDRSRAMRVRRVGFAAGQNISVWGAAIDEKTIDAEAIISCPPDEYVGKLTKELGDEKRMAPFMIVIGIGLIVFGAKKLREN